MYPDDVTIKCPYCGEPNYVEQELSKPQARWCENDNDGNKCCGEMFAYTMLKNANKSFSTQVFKCL